MGDVGHHDSGCSLDIGQDVRILRAARGIIKARNLLLSFAAHIPRYACLSLVVTFLVTEAPGLYRRPISNSQRWICIQFLDAHLPAAHLGLKRLLATCEPFKDPGEQSAAQPDEIHFAFAFSPRPHVLRLGWVILSVLLVAHPSWRRSPYLRATPMTQECNNGSYALHSVVREMPHVTGSAFLLINVTRTQP